MEHLGECEGLKEVYTSLRNLDERGEWRQPKLNLLGVSEKDGGLHEPLERGITQQTRRQRRLEASARVLVAWAHVPILQLLSLIHI